MSAVWLHIGQCGNQIGEEWWQILTSENVPHAEADGYPFCSPDGKLSAICMDSEPKVVRKLQKGVVRGQENSGLSSQLCEAIRDEYSLGQILSVMVALHHAGKSPLQHYNSLLCLSWLQRHVEDILLFQNNAMLRRTGALLGNKAPVSDMQPQVSLSAVNTYVASCLAGLLYPLKAFMTGSGISMGTEPWELLRSVCPTSTLKFLHMAQACKSYQEDTFLLSRDSVLRKLKQAYRCVPWNPFPLHCWADSLNIMEPRCHSHSLTVCINHSSSAELLQQVVARAEAMSKTNAYLHWYWRYGREEEDFQQAFETLCSVADDYSWLGE